MESIIRDLSSGVNSKVGSDTFSSTFPYFPYPERDHCVDSNDVYYHASDRGIGIKTPDGILTFLNGKNGGLPYEDVTSVAVSGDDIAAGFTIGGAHRRNGEWHYYQSGRWLPDDYVNDVAIGPDGSVWFATNAGISHIEYRPMTLAQKAALYQPTVQRHNRRNLFGDSPLRVPGDMDTLYLKTHDNENVWTGMYIASECFRYAATGDEEARRLARASMEAMLYLETVTGVPGLFARSFAAIDEDTGPGGEWHPSADGKWLWKGDTSSDEIVGRFFGFSVYYDLCANEKDKELIRGSVARTMSYIIDNDYYLLDIDGQPTKWGHWNPKFFKTDGKFQKNLNSLEILSFLKTAYYMTGDEKFQNAYRELIEKYGYAKNTVNAKINQPRMINHSDDLLAFLSYYPLLKYEKDTNILDNYYYKSIRRTWKIIKPTKNPLWNFIYAASVPGAEDFGLADAVWTLQRMPMDLIYWEVKNSHRTDIDIDPNGTMRPGEQQAVNVLPPDERFMLKFNENPFRLDGYWKGDNTEPATFWLLPYWMARQHGFIE